MKSIEMYYPTEVYIISNFKIDGTNHIQYKDQTRNRYENVRRKVLKACDVLKEPFILMNDDIYFTQEPDFPDWYDGTIKERIGGNNKYVQLLQKTLDHSKDGLNYSVHSPVVIHPDLFTDVTIEGLPFRNIYCSYSDREKREIKDPKLRTRQDHYRVEKIAKENPFFSTSDFSLKLIGGFMKKRFN